MTKKILTYSLMLLLIFSMCSFSLATQKAGNTDEVSPGALMETAEANEDEAKAEYAGIFAAGDGLYDIFEKLRENVLPIIPIFIVIGSIIYFIMGVRSKDKRSKGIGMMVVGVALYLLLQLIPLIMELNANGAFKNISISTFGITNTIIKQVQLISLPLTVFFIIIGYTLSNTVGARNMQKRRVGDSMVIGSIIFLIIINLIAIIYPLLFR